MAETQERLQPCLLDRLTDNEPEKTVESRDQRVVSPRRYKDAVLRDIGWLLNARARSLDEDIDRFPHVATSVYNYGIQDLCGSTATSFEPEDFRRMVVKAVNTFEPRLIGRTLKVRIPQQKDEFTHNGFVFEIDGELWAQPMSEQLFIKTAVDLETGECTLNG